VVGEGSDSLSVGISGWRSMLEARKLKMEDNQADGISLSGAWRGGRAAEGMQALYVFFL